MFFTLRHWRLNFFLFSGLGKYFVNTLVKEVLILLVFISWAYLKFKPENIKVFRIHNPKNTKKIIELNEFIWNHVLDCKRTLWRDCSSFYLFVFGNSCSTICPGDSFIKYNPHETILFRNKDFNIRPFLRMKALHSNSILVPFHCTKIEC